MEEQQINWLISLDEHILKLYSLAFILSTVFFVCECKLEIERILREISIKRKVVTLLILSSPFLLMPFLLITLEYLNLKFDAFLWQYSGTYYGREIWFTGLMLFDVFAAYLIITIHDKVNLTLSYFGTLIYKAFLFRAFFHIITYTQLTTFNEVKTLSEAYHLGIPAINIGIGFIALALAWTLKRENVYYGDTI